MSALAVASSFAPIWAIAAFSAHTAPHRCPPMQAETSGIAGAWHPNQALAVIRCYPILLKSEPKLKCVP
jgi:hypothetical protein